MSQVGYVYMLMNAGNTVIYTGVTSRLQQRVYEHRYGEAQGFTDRYNVKKLVYYEVLDDIASAIQREKQIKSGSRSKKLALIQEQNATYDDLYEMIC